MCGCRSLWPNHDISLFPLSLLSTFYIILAYLFSYMVSEPLFNPCQAHCCCVFVVSWLFPKVSGCFSVFRYDPIVSEHGGLVSMVVVVVLSSPWCWWLLLKYCCGCCWNCCRRCCDWKGSYSFLLWAAVCSVDYPGLCRLTVYSTFLLLQQLFVGVWGAGSVLLFLGVISCSNFSSWIFMQFQIQASVILQLEFEGGCWNI